MNARRAFRRGRYLSLVLAIFACACILSLLAFGFRATKEWQRSSELLIARDMEDSSDLLVTAVMRDMQGAQSRVLANRDWSEPTVSLADTSAQIASAFARYPYLESFFVWRPGDPGMTFFHRADRYPAWRQSAYEATGYPVVIDRDAREGRTLRQEIESHSTSRVRYLGLNTALGGSPYQVIARLTYADSLQSRLHSITGFTVSMHWVRKAYFADLFSQVTPIATGSSGLTVVVMDERGQAVWGTRDLTPRIAREFPLLFLDPTLGRVALVPDTRLDMWTIKVGPSPASPLQIAAAGAEEMLVVAGTAAFALCLGLVLSVRAVQDRATLAEMRSEFVSSVTHELKMPLANIRAVADTLTLRSVPSDKIRTYGGHLRHEARRLTHLVDNLLAYAKITDVANVYSFEPVVPARLVNEALRGFQQPLSQGGFEVNIGVPDHLPLVRADRGAMRLVLDNLIDNAIRYSKDSRQIQVSAFEHEQTIVIEVVDHGVGISAEELPVVRQQFVRGRFAEPGGSGLGLSIVSRIVADHAGSFALESTHGVGTTAKVALPIYRE